MELEEMKNIWKEEDKKLEPKIEINEKLINKMKMSTTVLEFDKLISRSIMGRNLALIYCAISLIMGSIIIEELVYSIPAIISGMAMLWSFVDHLSITKPDYSRISLIEFQKSICNFRIHTAKTAKYDIAIVLFWVITVTPLYMRLTYKTSIYSNPKYLAIFCLFSFVFGIVLIASSRKIYAMYHQKLTEAESDLEKILEFEKH